MERRLQLIEALRFAATERGECRLLRTAKAPGLFDPKTKSGEDAARDAVREGLLDVVRTEPEGRAVVEWVHVTQKGLDFLVEQESPARVMSDLADLLRFNVEGFPLWVAHLRAQIDQIQQKVRLETEAIRQQMEWLEGRVRDALNRLENKTDAPEPSTPWFPVAHAYLQARPKAGLGESTPLSELFAHLKEKGVALSLIDFHIGLRRLHDRGKVRLIPWLGDGGPPHPEFALLDQDTVYSFVAAAS